MGKITFILGGTKSGKTSFAQRRAAEISERQKQNVLYIATALALDSGMEKRIEAHKNSRPSIWVTAEESMTVSAILKKEAEDKAVVILDCLTMLSTNIIMQLGDEPDRVKAQELVSAEVKAILTEAEGIEAELIIISNQVESGLVAPTRLGGIFQDIAGISHQIIAAAADDVYLMTAGLPQKLKG